jgi:hypothetical protein
MNIGGIFWSTIMIDGYGRRKKKKSIGKLIKCVSSLCTR